MTEAQMSDTVLLCPGCAKAWSINTKYCENCSTSLHNAHVYVPMNATSDTAVMIPTAETQISPNNHAVLERIRANDYWALRARATTMTIIGYIQLVIGGSMILLMIVGFIIARTIAVSISVAFLTPQAAYAWYLVPLICLFIGYRQLIQAFTTFSQRDELLMRIDVAINTAVIATHITKLTQPTNPNQSHDAAV